MAKFDFEQFARGYGTFDENTWAKLASLYHQDAHFVDPVHDIRGHGAIEGYFKEMCESVQHCEFQLNAPVITEQKVVVSWQMIYRHKVLNSGNDIAVDGISTLTLSNGLIVEHRDYYDLGQMLYERIPVLGALIRMLRRRLAKGTEPQAGPNSSTSTATEVAHNE